MSSIRKEVHKGKEIFVCDFSNCKENQMIELVSEFRSTLIATRQPQLVLGIFNDKNFLTPRFMNAFKSDLREQVAPFISKQAVVGLSETKKMILKGYNLFFSRDIQPFDSTKAAIDFLIE